MSTPQPDLSQHKCDRETSWWEKDAQNIPLCRVCSECREAKLARYRPEILSGYTQADVDEPIEEDGLVLRTLGANLDQIYGEPTFCVRATRKLDI